MIVPLTLTQEPIWLEQLRYPDRVNAGFFLVTMSGAVAASAVFEACGAVCRRHPELRGTIVERDHRYWFQINDLDEVFEATRTDLPCPPGTEQERVRAWYLARRPIEWDLTAHAPIRFCFIDHGGERRTLLIAVHHIAFDGRSKFVFARELAQALRETREREAPAADDIEPAAPPPDSGSWEPDEADLAAATHYWRSRDLHVFPRMVLPRPDRIDAAGASMATTPRFELGESVFQRLSAITAEAGTSFFSGLLAATAAQLGRYGNDRLALCIPVDTSTEDTRERISMQVNMVPCVIEQTAGTSFRDLVATAGRVMAGIDRFRRVPFHLLMRELRKSYGVDIGPGIFDRFGVSYPRVPADLGEVPGLALDWDFFAPNSSRSFEVTLQLRKLPGTVHGRLDYATSVFDAATAEDFIVGWRETLGRALADPDVPLARGGSAAGHVSGVSDSAFGGSVEAVPRAGNGTAVIQVGRFLPTEERANFVAEGGRIVLVLDDSRTGPVAWGDWTPDSAAPDSALVLPHIAGEWRPAVVTPDGRNLPTRTPGMLVLRPTGGGSDLETGIRARLDGQGHLCYMGKTEWFSDFSGRLLDGADAERRIASLPGVRDVAVVPGQDALHPAPEVLLVPETASGFDRDAERTWRRRVLRVWPLDAPRPTQVLLAKRLPRDREGRVSLSEVRTICRDRAGS